MEGLPGDVKAVKSLICSRAVFWDFITRYVYVLFHVQSTCTSLRCEDIFVLYVCVFYLFNIMLEKCDFFFYFYSSAVYSNSMLMQKDLYVHVYNGWATFIFQHSRCTVYP